MNLNQYRNIKSIKFPLEIKEYLELQELQEVQTKNPHVRFRYTHGANGYRPLTFYIYEGEFQNHPQSHARYEAGHTATAARAHSPAPASACIFVVL